MASPCGLNILNTANIIKVLKKKSSAAAGRAGIPRPEAVLQWGWMIRLWFKSDSNQRLPGQDEAAADHKASYGLYFFF